MKLIVGLGNVGKHYAQTRHNIGWVVVDAFAAAHSVELKSQPKLKSMVGRAVVNSEEVILAKPITMMNDSGQAVQAVAHFYKVKLEDIVVIYDDLDIMFGSIKVKFGGSGRSHNGLTSVIGRIGSDFWRMRIGVDRQPRGIQQGKDFVLARFAPDEESQLDELIASATQILSDQLPDFSATTHKTLA